MSAPGEIQQQEPQLGMVSSTPNDSVDSAASPQLIYDLCLCLDVTGSMQDEIEAARNTLLEIVTTCRTKYNNYTFQLALLCYRDIKDRVRFIKRDFTQNIDSIITELKSVTAGGGDDIAEDVTGALYEINQMNWTGDKRQLVIVGDAPCHGRKYHKYIEGGVSDYYPDGDKFGRNPEEIVTELASKRIGILACQMNQTTKIMFNLFDIAYQNGRAPGTKANFILRDMTQQLADAKQEFIRKREEKERRDREEFERRIEEERRLVREAFIAEYGELPEGFDGHMYLDPNEDVERGSFGGDRSFGGDEFDECDNATRSGVGGSTFSHRPMDPKLAKFFDLQQERLSRLEFRPSEMSVTESPSEGVFSEIMLTAVSSQLD